MRGMYDKDGMIAYAGTPRASVRWRSSKWKAPSNRVSRDPRMTATEAIIANDARVEAAFARGARLRTRG